MNQRKKKEHFWTKLGPGLTTGASDDDPSGIATYTQAGAQFGLSTLWTAFLTLPLMINVFEMTGRITLATSKDLSSNLKAYYPKYLSYFIMLFCYPAITFNVGANLAAAAEISNLLLPAIPSIAFSTLYCLILGLGIVFFSYKKILNYLKWTTLALFAYILVPFMQEQNWGEILYSTFVPQFKWTKDYFLMLVAIIGTTISPYLYFWHGITTLEEKNHDNKKRTTTERINYMKVDVSIGMIYSNLVMYFIILTAGTTLFKTGTTEILDLKQAAQALHPLVGEYSFILFSLGVLGSAALSIPVLSTQLGYMACKMLSYPVGMDEKFLKAKVFYGAILGSLILGWMTNLLRLNPMTMLIYTSVIYGILCPLLQGLILHIANNKEVMGKRNNGWLSNLFGFISLFLMTFSALILFYFWIFES